MQTTGRLALWMTAAAGLVACTLDAGGARPRASEGGGAPTPGSAATGADVGNACASGASGASGPSASIPDLGSLDLTGDGSRLRLSGAPADPTYAASYPVEGLVGMGVRVQANATLVTKCVAKSGEVPCQDHPFYSRARGELVEVFDVYGKLVLAANAPARSATCVSVDAGRPSCAFLEDIQQEFCRDVNEMAGANHAIDCGALTT